MLPSTEEIVTTLYYHCLFACLFLPLDSALLGQGPCHAICLVPAMCHTAKTMCCMNMLCTLWTSIKPHFCIVSNSLQSTFIKIPTLRELQREILERLVQTLVLQVRIPSPRQGKKLGHSATQCEAQRRPSLLDQGLFWLINYSRGLPPSDQQLSPQACRQKCLALHGAWGKHLISAC